MKTYWRKEAGRQEGRKAGRQEGKKAKGHESYNGC